MITPAAMFGAFNQLAEVMVIREIQAAFSGSDQPAVADQPAPQDALAPAQGEIQPPVSSSPEPLLAAFLPTPSPPAGQTLLGMAPPQTTSAPAFFPASYFGDASAPALLATSLVINDAGWNAAPAPPSLEAATAASPSDIGTPSNSNTPGQNATPAPSASGGAATAPASGGGTPANSNAAAASATPQSSAPVGGTATPASAASTMATLSGAGASLALGSAPIAPPTASLDNASMEEGGTIADAGLPPSVTKVQVATPGATLLAGNQTPGRAATAPTNATASSPSEVADATAKGVSALGIAQNRASGDASPAPLSALAQRQDAAPVADQTAAFAERLDPSGGGAAPLQMESAGVIDSFILNAAMIPGWPLQRPFEPLGPEAMGAYQPLLQGMDEEELVDYLAAMGANDALNERIRKASDDPVRRRKLLRSLVILIAVVTTIIDSMRAEIEALVADLRAGQTPGVALAPHSGRRLLLE